MAKAGIECFATSYCLNFRALATGAMNLARSSVANMSEALLLQARRSSESSSHGYRHQKRPEESMAADGLSGHTVHPKP